jgi:hypothetical protein
MLYKLNTFHIWIVVHRVEYEAFELNDYYVLLLGATILFLIPHWLFVFQLQSIIFNHKNSEFRFKNKLNFLFTVLSFSTENSFSCKLFKSAS